MIGAVDIGGTKIAVGMLDRSGKILARRGKISAAWIYLFGMVWRSYSACCGRPPGKPPGLGKDFWPFFLHLLD
jgi:hypothetical protein